MKEVAPGIFRVTLAEKGRWIQFSVNAYIIAGKDGLVFDAGYGRKNAVNTLVAAIKKVDSLMQQRGIDTTVRRVLPSHGHWDHFSGIAGLREKIGLRVLATSKMLKSIRSKKQYLGAFRYGDNLINPPSSCVKKRLQMLTTEFFLAVFLRLFNVRYVTGPVEIVTEGSILKAGGRTFEVIGLPGHCDDDIVLYDRTAGILLAGDILLRTVTTWLGPPRSDLAAYIKSLEYLLALDNLQLILPAHGSPVTDPKTRLRAAIAHRQKRTEEIYTLLREGGSAGLTFQQVFRHFYPQANYFQQYILRGWILTTIEYLLATGKIQSHSEKNQKRFRAIDA